jgi:hypothetical protein
MILEILPVLFLLIVAAIVEIPLLIFRGGLQHRSGWRISTDLTWMVVAGIACLALLIAFRMYFKPDGLPHFPE